MLFSIVHLSAALHGQDEKFPIPAFNGALGLWMIRRVERSKEFKQSDEMKMKISGELIQIVRKSSSRNAMNVEPKGPK